jgi:hypothetical protein
MRAAEIRTQRGDHGLRLEAPAGQAHASLADELSVDGLEEGFGGRRVVCDHDGIGRPGLERREEVSGGGVGVTRHAGRP